MRSADGRRRGAWLAPLLVLGGTAAQTRIAVGLPPPLGPRLVRELRSELADSSIVVALAAAGGPEAVRSLPAGTVLVGVLEWQLARSTGALGELTGLGADLPAPCRDVRGRWALPWSMRYAVAFDPARLADGPPPAGFEQLALDARLHDRLGLCAPAVDPAPWLLAMQEVLQRGGGEAAGYGLWTALDARAGAYCSDYERMLDDLMAGRLLAGVLPVPVIAASAASRILQQQPLGAASPQVRLGVAVSAPADAGSSALAQRLCALPLRDRLAAALQLDGAASRAPGLDPARVDGWLQHFEQRIQGQGRGVERIADVLDYVLTALFVLIGWFVWRRLRAEGPDSAAR